MLPCSLSKEQEEAGLALAPPVARDGIPLRVLFIGRLDSYKRLDWLIRALAHLTSPWRLAVVGDGPKRKDFEQLAHRLFLQTSPVTFHGRLSETSKLQQLAASDVLVLPSDRSNEAFGIVQLEAMAAGRPSLAFNHPRSEWVGLGNYQVCLGYNHPMLLLRHCKGLQITLCLGTKSVSKPESDISVVCPFCMG